MELLGAFLSEQTVERIGWVLVHFLWQGVAVAMLMWVVLKSLSKTSSNVRYITVCMGLALMVASPVATFFVTTPDVPLVAAETPLAMPVAISTPSEAAPVKNIVISSSDKDSLPASSIWKRSMTLLEASLPYCVVGWTAGVAVLSVWYLGGWCQLQKLRRIGTKTVSDTVEANTTLLWQRLGIRRVVQVVESALVQVPTVIGWFKPMILLPATALTGLDEMQLNAMIAHELAHIKRCDYLVNIAQTVVEILGFYHPAVWWVSCQIRIERENCCDDMAVALIQSRREYAGALFTMEAIRSKQLDLAVAANGGHLQNRISRLAGKPAQHQKSGWLPSLVSIVFIATFMIPAAMALRQEAEVSSQESEETATENTENQEFKKTLSNGVTVELISVCKANNNQHCWSPNGNLLSKTPYYSTGSWQGSKAYEFAFRVKDFGEQEPSTWWRINGKYATGSGNKEHPSDQAGKDIKDIWVIDAKIIEGVEQCDLSFAVAANTWQTQATCPGIEGAVRTEGDRPYIFSPAYIKNDILGVTVSDHMGTIARRLIAIDNSGKTHLSETLKLGETKGLHQTTFGFKNLSLNRIKEFQFQIRPYEWVTFKNISLHPGEKTEVDVQSSGQEAVDSRQDVVIYQVNRKVSDFPEIEDFSTPESAYAAINRVMAADDHKGWIRVSAKHVAERLKRRKRKGKIDPEWSNVVLNANILEVRIKDDHAVVIAEYPQELTSKPIQDPIDGRHLVFENGKWLNTGQDRYGSIESARAKFDKILERNQRTEQAYADILDQSEMFARKADELFERLMVADYQNILNRYNEKTGRWNGDGWKKLGIDYRVHTDWPSFALCVYRMFKDNPIQSFELGDLFISDKEITDGFKAPAIPYIIILQDGETLEGDLYFIYRDSSKDWQAAEGIDWHLQRKPIKRRSVVQLNELLQKPVSVQIEHSPQNDRLSVQFAVIAVCEAAGVPYNWNKSAQLADPERRRYVEPITISNKNAARTIADLLGPIGLLYGVDADGLYLYRSGMLTQVSHPSSVIINEGIGFDDIAFGCTGDFIKSKLGKPDKEVHDEKDWWINYRKTYGLGFWVNPQENFLIEIRLNEGFKGQLESGISMSSTKQEVFDVYGEPVHEEIAKDFDRRFDNQVLLYRSKLIGKSKLSKIYYNQHGLLFWFDGDTIKQIVASRKIPETKNGKTLRAEVDF